MARLTDEELLETLESQLPALLERHPELETRVYGMFIHTFATKKEVAAILAELQTFRAEVRERCAARNLRLVGGSTPPDRSR